MIALVEGLHSLTDEMNEMSDRFDEMKVKVSYKLQTQLIGQLDPLYGRVLAIRLNSQPGNLEVMNE